MKKIIILFLIIFSIFFIYVTNFKFSINSFNFVPKSDKNTKFDNFGYVKINKLNMNYRFKYQGNVDKEIVALNNPIGFYNDNSYLVLAGHSGTGIYAYFNYLYKLTIGDSVSIYYMNKYYNYKIVDIFYKKKTGNISIYKVKNNSTLVLITCTNNKKNYQTVYICIRD